MSSKVGFSNLLVICNEQNDFDNIAQLLSHYLPNHHHESALFISNKYYQAHVNILFKTWTETLNSLEFKYHPSEQLPYPSKQLPQSEEICPTNHKQLSQNLNQVPPKETLLKYDLMIMLVDQKPQSIINFESLDQIIEKFNPEEFMLLINTPNPQDPWIYEEKILQKCNNFIQIVKEDLWKINKTRPNWARGALLNNQQEINDSGIFSILDRIQTTRWATMVNVKKQQPEQKNKMILQDSSSAQNGIKQNDSENQQLSHFNSKNQQIQPSDSSKSKKNLDKNNIEKSSDQEQTDEKRLEQEMKQFEDMMSQMMSFQAQSANMKHEERKQKAEQLFANMFKGMMTFK